MSYRLFLRSLPKNIQNWSRQPGGIAAIASVGIHGLLWAILPILPMSSAEPSEPEIQRKVGLVELTPEELSRVPDLDFSTSIPAVPLPINPPALDQFSLTPLPNQPPIQYPSILPPSFYIPPAPTAPSRIYIPSRPTTRPSTQATTPRQTPAPTPTPTPDPTIIPNRLNGNTRRLPELQAARPEPPDVTASPSATPAPAGDPNPSAPAASPSPTQSRAEQLLAEQRELQALYTYSPQGTTNESANSAFAQWFYNDLGKESLDDLDQVEIKPPYPRGACPLRRTAIATYGVVVNANDEVAGEPRILRRSGFPVFDQDALEAIASHDFSNDTDADQAYQVNVIFEYNEDDCPAGAVQQPVPPS
jgi:hypothetical protein